MTQDQNISTEQKVSSGWKPNSLIASMLALFSLPLGFFYAGRPGVGIIYLVCGILVSTFDYIKHKFIAPDSSLLNIPFALLFVVAAVIHAFLLAQDTKPRPKPWYAKPAGLIGILAIILTPLVIIRSFFYEPFSVPSNSMAPTITIGDLIVISKKPYGNYGTYGVKFSTGKDLSQVIKRGDVLAFHDSVKNDVYIRRVVGLPGDTIKYEDTRLYINGKLIQEKLISSLNDPRFGNYKIYEESFAGQPYHIKKMDRQFGVVSRLEGEWTVPQGHYFMMGDNREMSKDSRIWKAIPQANIIGKVVYIW